MASTNNIPQFDKYKNNLDTDEQPNGYNANSLISSSKVNGAIYNCSLAISALMKAIADSTTGTNTYSSNDSLDELAEHLQSDIENWLVKKVDGKDLLTLRNIGNSGNVSYDSNGNILSGTNGQAIYQNNNVFASSGYTWTYSRYNGGTTLLPIYNYYYYLFAPNKTNSYIALGHIGDVSTKSLDNSFFDIEVGTTNLNSKTINMKNIEEKATNTYLSIDENGKIGKNEIIKIIKTTKKELIDDIIEGGYSINNIIKIYANDESYIQFFIEKLYMSNDKVSSDMSNDKVSSELYEIYAIDESSATFVTNADTNNTKTITYLVKSRVYQASKASNDTNWTYSGTSEDISVIYLSK